MIDFHVGQKVVCVDAVGCEDFDGRTRIAEGEIYKIRRVGVRSIWYCIAFLVWGRPLWVWLEGVDRGNGYRATRFRPLIHTDISVFTAMLAPSPKVKEREDA